MSLITSSVLSSSPSPLQNPKENKPTDSPSTLSHGTSVPLEIKPLSLPSLASITSNLSSNILPSLEPSQFGPHRSCPMGVSSGRRFSPLSHPMDYGGSVSPLDSEHSASIFGEGRPNVSGISLIMASTHRPRSHSFLSGPSLIMANLPEADVHVDESASDSGSSDKKHEDSDALALSKKRSRTLTTPSQQRRLMQILEQTRFPSTDVREQLARELGMTPRRVQIWFQNRRQGMKKALEQKPEQETSATPTSNLHRPRGFSFGAYPAPADVYTQSGVHPLPQTKFTLPAHGSSPAALPHQAPPDPVDGQEEELYAPRSVSRGVPRNLHLQLSPDHLAASNHETTGSSVADFMWSDSSTASSLYSTSSSLVDKEANFTPFAKVVPHSYTDSLSREPPLPAVSTSRHRSQTNPDLFGMMNGFLGLSEPGHMSSEPINPFQTISHSSTQRAPFNRCTLSSSKNDLWSHNYGQTSSNWHESFEPLRLESSHFSTDQPLYHLHANPDKATEAAAGLYYPPRNQEPIMEDTIGFSTLQLGCEAPYGASIILPSPHPDLSDNAHEAALLAQQHHFRQRSQSLNSFV